MTNIKERLTPPAARARGGYHCPLFEFGLGSMVAVARSATATADHPAQAAKMRPRSGEALPQFPQLVFAISDRHTTGMPRVVRKPFLTGPCLTIACFLLILSFLALCGVIYMGRPGISIGMHAVSGVSPFHAEFENRVKWALCFAVLFLDFGAAGIMFLVVTAVGYVASKLK